MCDREKWIWIVSICLLSIYILSRLGTINLTNAQNLINSFIAFFHSHKTMIDGWTYSFISGVLVYFLTVTFPHAKKSLIVLPKLCETIRLLKDDFRDLSDSLCFTNWCADSFNVIDAINAIKYYGRIPINETFYSLNYCRPILKSKVELFDSYIDSVLNHQEELNNHEIKVLLEIKYSNIFAKIRSEDYLTTYMAENELKDLIESLRKENKKAVNIYNEMCKRCFKSQYKNQVKI